MEAPNTPEKTLDFKFAIQINSNKNIIYEIIFKAQTYSYLEIKAKSTNDLLNKSFSNKFTTEKIKENKYFSMCDDLKEICSELENRLKLKEINLKENDNNLVISISLPTIKIKEITFTLKEDKQNSEDKINSLTKIIVELKNEIKKLKEDKIEMKKEIDEIKLNHKKDINDLKEKIEKLIKKDELNESKILKSEEEFSFIYSLFQNKRSFELLYQATRDGSYPKDFHEKCDNKGPTITLIQTDDNHKFGGFISKDREYGNSNEVSVKDKKAFIFSINKKAKYNIKGENINAFTYSSIRGPNFTSCLGFYLNVDSGNMFAPQNSYEYETIPDYNSFNKYEFAGKNNFKAIEIEVFKVNKNYI